MSVNGLLAIVKRDCPTCALVAPVLADLEKREGLTVYCQDDPTFPEDVSEVADDTALDVSYRLGIEIVPTLIRLRDGDEVARTFGWDRAAWQEITGHGDLGAELPEARPGCGALNQDPERLRALKVRHGDTGMVSRPIDPGSEEDLIEACYDRDWTDGLPVVPPTETRVLAMLEGTARRPGEVLGEMPPGLGACTVEKVAVNAVMAGCRPEYLPVVLTAIEAILEDDFALHGVLATTRYVSPVLVVNGPIAGRIGMNAGGNALGQGNRANATIGRAVQLAVRNIGGGKPGGVDRATLGNPGKYTYCFAEDEAGSAWTPLTVDRGLAAGSNAVTAFPGYGLQGIIDERARTADELAETFATCLRAVDNNNKFPAPDVIVVVGPEHERTFTHDGWDKAHLHGELLRRLTVPADTVMPGQNGIREGAPASLAGQSVCKFRPDGLLIVRAGGQAGKFSGIIGGFAPGGAPHSIPVTKEVKS
jgi:hypothetical protein